MTSFIGETGPAVPISSDPMELFSLFFDDEVVGHIITETNTYDQQCLANSSTMWQTTASEIRAYIGFQILMGINQLPEIRDYWAKDDKLQYDPIASRISRNRFEEISRYLHLLTTASYLQGENRGTAGYRKCNPLSLQ